MSGVSLWWKINNISIGHKVWCQPNRPLSVSTLLKLKYKKEGVFAALLLCHHSSVCPSHVSDNFLSSSHGLLGFPTLWKNILTQSSYPESHLLLSPPISSAFTPISPLFSGIPKVRKQVTHYKSYLLSHHLFHPISPLFSGIRKVRKQVTHYKGYL